MKWDICMHSPSDSELQIFNPSLISWNIELCGLVLFQTSTQPSLINKQKWSHEAQGFCLGRYKCVCIYIYVYKIFVFQKEQMYCPAACSRTSPSVFQVCNMFGRVSREGDVKNHAQMWT